MKKPTILKMPHLNLLTLFSNKTCIFFKTIFVAMLFEPTNKKRFLSNALAMVGILLFMTQGSYGQALKSFGKRYDETLKGDILVIGNNILNRDFGTNGNRANDPYNIQGSSSIYNENTNMKWINIDPDGGNNFNSSSAKLTIPAASQSCYKILYAALYWSGTYSIAADYGSASGADRSKINKVRFKVGTGSYVDLTGNVIYDYVGTSGGTGAMSPATAQSARNPYACMIDVTNYVVTGGETNYTVANIASSEGGNYTSAGHSAGWSLFVVYEDPKQPSKFITSFDGFARIKYGDPAFTFPINGFKTIPSGPVKAKIAFTALEGDNRDASDNMAIVGNTIAGSVAESVSTMTTNLKPRAPLTPNIFNSSINNLDVNFTDRVPNSLNTFGFDTGVVELKNGGGSNTTIKNGETGANITLSTGADWYYLFFTALAVEVIEPKIILTKTTLKGVVPLPNNAPVKLGDILTYELQFQNVGNDNAKNFTITDQLPVNTIFKYPADIEIPLQAGVTHSYNSATRTITFTIADNLVTKNGNLSVPIRFKVQVVPTCANLTEPCNNIIKNTAKSKYTGEINTNGGLGFEEDSFSSYSACDISVPESTNFLVGVDDCKARNAVLCGDPLIISASGGYASYSWSTSPTGVPVIGTTQTITVTQPGTYYVKNTATPPCVDLEEVITVSGYDAKFNPLVKYADNKDAITGEIPVCPNDGSVLPKIFLCTEDDKVDIDLSDLGATNITWETTTCVADPNLSDLCANESTTCTWTQAGPPGATFVANTAGQYRVSMSFGGCFSRFYFNVYKNGLKPTVTKKDIICGNNGSITIGGISGTGYEYSLSENSGYTSNNTFSISTAGTYTVYIRQVGVATNPCPFKVEGISIYKTDFDPIAPFVTQPLCHDSKGSIKVYGTAYNGAQYTYELFKGGVSIEKVINSTASEYEFLNKDAGSYTYTVTTLDGCSYNGVAEIIAPAALTAVASITKPLTCSDGEITVTPNNGTAPFNYFINGSTTAQTDPKIVVTTAGTYSIRVVDGNGCEVTISQRIDANPKPVFTIAKTDVLCYGAKSGVITFNVTNANGYTLAYSIDNGVTYVANGTFSSLAPGTYKPILKYTLSGVDCFETRPDITITEPAAALTASAGVSELAGCGLAGEGKVRITNPQGGTPFASPNPPYLFSFDNQATWTATNDAYKAPGTYTLYVKDANNCIFSAPVIVDPEPAEPVINVTPKIDFNCDGTATSTVTVANPPNASYTYDYYLNDVKNTNVPSNVFVNVPSGSHSIKVEYKLNAVPTFSNLLFENFGYGEDTTSPGINTAFYCFERQVVATQCRGSNAINDGDYSVTSFIVNPFGAWVQPGDHTPQTVPPTPKGRSLVVNIGDQIATSDILYQKVINDIIPNQPINFELYAMNLLRTGNTQVNADLRVALVDATGTEISWFATGEIPKTQRWEQYPKTPVTLNPGDNTTLRFIIRSNKRATSGNDVAIDDIKVFQLPKTCISSRSFPLTIDPGKAFTAQITGQKNVTCNDLTNGEFTITATNFDTTKGYQYSTNNGATWSAALFASPETVNNLVGNLYKVIVRPVGSTIATCSIPFDVTISVPTALTLSASVTTPATCTTGATITAIGGGGTLTYQYELRQGTAIIVPYTNNGGVFTNVAAGNYTVFVKDANGCEIPVGVAVNVTAPPALTAAVIPSTALCFDPTTGAQINVSITGGTAPYSYQTRLNGGAFSASSATFTTLSFTHTAAVTGNYVFRVTDNNGCSFDTVQQVINAKVTANAQVTTDLDCDPAPNDQAIISGTISGGTAPFTVIKTSGPGTILPVVSGNTFTYTTGVASAYQFEITDAIGCKTTTSATINAKVAVTGNAVVTNETCETLNNGSVTLQALTGVAPFEYSFNGSAFSSTVTYGSLLGSVAGTSYPYQIRDRKGCIYDGTTVVFEPTPITLSASITTPYTCTTNATITASASNGNGGFTYVLRRGATTVATNTTGLFPNLTVAGSYTVTVTDAKGCPLTSAAMVIDALTPPTNPVFTEKPITCKSTELTSEVTISVTGGKGILKYEITAPASAITNVSGATTGIFTGLTAGAAGTTYAFKVTDENNCSVTGTYTVKDVLPVIVNGSLVANVTCKTAADGKLKFTVSGNAGTFTYELRNSLNVIVPIGQSTQTGNVIDYIGLAADTYTLTVTNPSTDCKATKVLKVDEPSVALSFNAPTISPFTCNPLTRAGVTINTTGGWGSNRYTLTLPNGTVVGPQTSAIFANLTQSGLYTIAVTDLSGNGCTITETFTIAPYTTLSVSATVNGQCFATGSSFQIVAVATGGSGAYTYSINTGVVPSPADTFTVAPGTYTITVRDALGCTAPVVVTVNEVLTAAAVRTKELDCTATPNATIRIDAFGGKPAYNYEVSFNGGPYGAPVAPATIVGNVFTTSVAGTYKFRITDSNIPTACTAETNNVVISPIVYPEIITLVEKQSIKCNGDATGIIEVTIDPSKGVGPFKYSIDGTTYQNSNQFTGLIAGTYTITVKDNKDCTFTYPTPIVIAQPDAITFDLDKVDIKCNDPGGTSLGEIKVLNVLGGTATSATPFRYFITNNFGDVIAGNPYTASTTGREDHIFTVINFGVYTVNVVDANGCSLSKQITIASPPEDLDINVTTLSSNCTTGGTAIVKTISAVGSSNYEFGILETNSSPYTTIWYTPDVVGGDTKTFTNLTPGVTYTFVVHDLTTLCYYVKSADQPIAPASTLTSTVTPINVTCKGNNDGKVTFTIDDFDATTTSIDYQLFTSFSNVAVGPSFNVPVTFGTPVTIANFSPIAGTLAPGSYYIRFIENGTGTFNGCKSASTIFEIKESSVDLSVSASVIKNENCNQLGIISALAKDGAGTYSYIILPSTAVAPTASDPAWNTTSTFNVAAGSYLVYAKDANGCIKVTPATIDLIKDPEPVIALSVTDNCAAEGAFSLDVDLTSPGVGPYTISVNGGSPQNVGSFPYTVSGLSSGPQNIIVYDANGCPSNSPALTLHKKVSVIAERTKELDCTISPDGLITVTVSDGLFTASDATPDFRYEVSINGAPYLAPVNFANDVRVFTYPVTTAGTYQFRITDLNNCTVESTVVDIAAIVNPTATATVTQPTCVGLADGSIKITATGGVLPYEYSIDGGTTWQDSNEFTGLAAVTVNYIVRDAKLCLFNGSENIINPSPVVASASPSVFTCSPTNTPNVTVVTLGASGGAGTALADYTFSRDNVNWSSTNTFDVIDTGATQILTFFAKDANGCVDSVPITIDPFPKLVSAVASLGTKADCNTHTEIINLAVSGGAFPYDFKYEVSIDGAAYVLVNASTGNSISYPATSIGSFYEFKITDNTTGCSIISNAYTVPVFNTMTVTASAAANVDCATNATGAIEINIGNYTGPYNYEVFNGATSVYSNSHSTLTSNPFVIPFGLVAGNNYTVEITQTAYPSCIKTSNPVAITEPAALDLSGPFVTVKNQNCNTTGAVVTVDDTKILGGKRDYTYVFVLNGSGALPPAGDFKPTKTVTFATTVGSTDTVEVWVKDANGCYSFVTVPISLDPAPTVTATVASQCANPAGYTILAVGADGVGPYKYSLDGISFGTLASLTVTSPGDYDVWVKDANDCIAKTTGKVTIFEPLQLRADVVLSTCTAADGEVTLTASGGSALPANYEYKIGVGGTYGSSNVFGGLSASATPYTFYVRDISTVPACEKMVEVTMFLPNQNIDFDLATTPVTCNGGSDGTIRVNMAPSTPGVNDNPIYTYALKGTTVGGVAVTIPLTGTQPSPLFSGLAAGTYTVTVTSGRGCSSVPETIVVAQPDPILVPTPNVVPFGCTSGNTGNLATITVTGVTGGSGTYLNYEFIKNGTPVQFGASNIYTEANLLGGTYSVNVYDTNGCPGTSSPFTIAPFVQLDQVIVDVTRPITCNPATEDIAVSVTTISGAPATNLQYTLVDVSGAVSFLPNTTGDFTGLTIGNYLITVRNLDTNCEITSVHYVNNPNTFDLTIDNVVDVTCLNDTNGSARVTLIDRVPTPIDNAGPFDYTVTGPTPSTGTSTAAGVVNLTNLAVGTYTITATLNQAPSCTVIKNFTITGPNELLQIFKTHTKITCITGNNDGSISATATGGWPGGYNFELLNGTTTVQAYGTNASWTGLTAGNYTVNVKDSKGCIATVVVPLVNPTPIAFTVTPSTTLLTCKGNTDASITVGLPTGGQGTNYLYTLNTTSATPVISSGPQASNVFTNLGAGTYTVTVTDGWGCGTPSAPIVIAEPTEVVASLVLTSTATCSASNPATITLSATGGTGPYEYSAVPTSGWFPMGGNTITFSVAPDTYRYFVRDANGCISMMSNDIKVEPLPALQVVLNVDNAKINCNGDTNGVIVATAIGGLGNYVYTLLDGTGNPVAFTPVQTTPGNFTQLPAGTYSVRVDSGDCFAFSVSEVIEEPLTSLTASSVPTPITCNGAANGIITVTASGGTGVIKYAISPRLDQFFDTGVFDQLAPDTYQIIVQDENGCFILLSETITEPQPIFVNTVAGSEIQEVCFGDNNARFDVNITGGVMPYSVTLDDINGTYVTGALSQTVFNFTDLSGGEHTVYIKDANGCPAEWIVTLDESVNLDPKATVAYGCDNNSPSNTVTVTVDASITNPADVDYALDGSTVFQASNIFSNVAPGFHTITARHTNGCEKTTIQFEVLGFTPLALTLSDGGLNEIVATATGGAGNYQYSFDGRNTFSSNNKLIYYKSGDYTVIVRDANGCEATATRYFEFIDIEIPNVFTPNGDGNNDTWTPTNTINYKDLTINIFDRYGRKVATLREGQGWDGKYNSLELPSGDYWYVLKLKNVQDDREFVGHFTLMR